MSPNHERMALIQKKHKHSLAVLICAVLLLTAVILSLTTGSYALSPGEILNTLLGRGDRLQAFTLFELRLPRTVLALIVGAALGISGGVLQAITRNPLAEPGMTGINAGAALFVVLWISSGSGANYSALSMSTARLIPLVAMAGGLLSALFIYLFAYKKGLRPVRFILTGIGVNAGILAVISFYQLNMSKGDYNQVLTWTSGSLWGSSWDYIMITLPVAALLAFVILARSRTLDALALGDTLAQGVGVHVRREMLFFLMAAAFLAAAATAVAGNIAFLGLLGPQLARRLTRPVHKRLLPLAAVISAAILIFADTAARNLFSPIELPVGIVVSILGVPYFIYLMFKGK